MRSKVFIIVLVVLALVFSACTDAKGNPDAGFNPVEETGLHSTTKIELYDLTGDDTVPILQLDEAEDIEKVTTTLDTALPVTPKTFCAPHYALHFHINDGSIVEISYFCDGNAPFIRSDEVVFDNEDYAVSESFTQLMDAWLAQQLTGSETVSEDSEYKPGSELANPASVHCVEQGGSLEIRTDETGGQFGVCIFDDGSECEEWAFFRGECKPGE